MKSTVMALLFVALGVSSAWGQNAVPQDRFPLCQSVIGYTGPYNCPNGSKCGQYINFSVDTCNLDDCTMLVPYNVCCNAYPNYQVGGGCSMAEMKSPRVRRRILELAEENEILVPTCSGAYIPARIAFRQYHEARDARE